jgi:hypothetical protein
VTGCGVIRAISSSSSRASCGEPSASITTTPAGVTTKPALEMKLRLAAVPRAASPCTNQAEGETCCATTLRGAGCCAQAAAASSTAATAAMKDRTGGLT